MDAYEQKINDQRFLIETQRAVIDKLEAELDKHRWISVSERLPEIEQLIMLIHTEKKIRKRLFIWSGNESDIQSLREHHTHWKPIILPEQAPKENE